MNVRSSPPAKVSTAAPPSDGKSSSLRIELAKRFGGGIGEDPREWPAFVEITLRREG
jgi:hypothetical protein